MNIVVLAASIEMHKEYLVYDVRSLDLWSGELRLIEVKGLAFATGTILLTPDELRVSKDRADCFWLYVVTNCANTPESQGLIKDPARFSLHAVTNVDHYCSDATALNQPTKARKIKASLGCRDRL